MNPSERTPTSRTPPRALCTLILLLSACSGPAEQTLELQGATMGTTYSVKIPAVPDGVTAETLSYRISERLKRINALMSTYQPESELSRFNAHRSDDWFNASPELVQLIDRARTISELSGGAFDITVGPAVNLWGFGPEVTEFEMPDDRSIDAVRARVGFRMLEHRLQPPALRKTRPDLYVDLSAIAKGYGVDQIASLLETTGIEDYLVEIGGEVRAKGTKLDGRRWRVAIERPDPRSRSVYQVVELRDAAMATSGDYRNFFSHGDRRYSHTIDPETARPVEHHIASVTVLDTDCTDADALATALLVMGPERGYALAKSHNIAAFFVARTATGFNHKTTSAFDNAVDRGRGPSPVPITLPDAALGIRSDHKIAGTLRSR